MPVIDDIRENHGKLKGKSFKDKIEYFWEYYRIPALAIFVAVFIVVSLIKTFLTAKQTGFEVVFLNSIGAPSSEEFSTRIDLDLKKYDVVFDDSMYINPDPDSYDENSYNNTMKLMAQIAARDVDVIVGDPLIMERYFDAEVFADLREYFDDEYLDSLGDKVIWHEPIDTMSGEKIADAFPMAIDVSGFSKIKDVPCFVDKGYFSIVISTEHPDYVKEFYKYISE